MTRMNWAGSRFVMTTAGWRWASIDVCWRLDLIVVCSRSETTGEYSRWELIAGCLMARWGSVPSPKSVASSTPNDLVWMPTG